MKSITQILKTTKNPVSWFSGASLLKQFAFIAAIMLTMTGSVLASGSLVATWNANTETDLAGYKIYYGTTSGDRSGWTTVDAGNTTQYVLTDLLEGTRYYMVVTAYDMSGNESAASSEVNAIATSRNAYVSLTTSGIQLTWDAVTGADSYEIYRDPNPYFTPVTPYTTVSTNQYLDDAYPKTPEAGKYYIIKAKAGQNTLFTFNTLGAFNIKLYAGKNLVSLPLIPADSSLTSVLGTQLTGSSFSTRADKVYTWDGSAYVMAWLVEGTTSTLEGKWLKKTGEAESTIKLNPSQSFWIELVNPLPDSIVTVTGQVSTAANRTITLTKGMNFIGSCYPANVTLKNSNLGQSEVVAGGLNSSVADKIMHWQPNNVVDVAWLVTGSGTSWDGEWVNERGNALSSMTFKAGHGYILTIKNTNPVTTWQFPNPNN